MKVNGKALGFNTPSYHIPYVLYILYMIHNNNPNNDVHNNFI